MAQAPGWYPDPDDPSRNMYWDGRAWHRNGPPAAAAPPRKRKKRHPILWTLGILLLIGWIGSQCDSSNKKDTSSTKESSTETAAAPATSANGKAPSVIKMVLAAAGTHYGITLEPVDVGRHVLDDVNSERVPFDWANWRIVTQCENFVDGKLPVGVIKQEEFQRLSDFQEGYGHNVLGPDSLIGSNGLSFTLNCPNDPAEKSNADTPSSTTAATTATTPQDAVDRTIPPTDAQVREAFQAYINERADAGVMMAKSVTSVAFSDGVVTITLDAPPALLELSPFDNEANG
jgi:hypothetical protein